MLGFGCGVWGVGFEVWGVGCEVWSVRCRVWVVSFFLVWGLGSGVWGHHHKRPPLRPERPFHLKISVIYCITTQNYYVHTKLLYGRRVTVFSADHTGAKCIGAEYIGAEFCGIYARQRFDQRMRGVQRDTHQSLRVC